MTKLKVLDLFSGIGGFSLGLERTGGFKTVAFCEINADCRAVLRQHWPEVPIYEDVRTIKLSNGLADVICGGFPCQDVSIANTSGRPGLAGERSGLWRYLVDAIRVVRPQYAIVENVAALLGDGMGIVLGDLATIGYDAEWDCFPAYEVGRPTVRARVWIVAFPMCSGRQGRVQYLSTSGFAPAPSAKRRDEAVRERAALVDDLGGLRSDYGFSVTVERQRIHQFGNAVVPQIPELIGRAILQARAA